MVQMQYGVAEFLSIAEKQLTIRPPRDRRYTFFFGAPRRKCSAYLSVHGHIQANADSPGST